ncbi:MAG: hypothetical protein K6F36_04585 [Bacilli bacterium]|nr:hypothetical protein [Bacilli bacterium]
MYTRVTKKTLLLLATSLLLTGCTDNPENSASNVDSENVSNTSMDESYTSGNSDVSSMDSSSAKGTDYYEGWDPAIDSEIRRSLGGNGLPFFDLTGEIKIIHVDKTADTNAHMLITSDCAYDQHLVYRAKTQFELAGWTVSYNNAATPSQMRLDASQDEQGISLTMYGKPNGRDGSFYPAIEVYFTEVYNEPVKGTNWSDNTLSVLSEIGVQVPHMLPYVYLAAYNDTAEKKTNKRALIKGGDWISYEKRIVAVARKALSTSKNWAETNGNVTGSGHYKSSTYTFTKTFSDGYTIQAKLYGDAADGSFTSLNADDVVTFLDVTCTAPRN